MTLTNFWWLLIWMFTGGLLIAVMSTDRQSMAGIRYDKARSGLPVLSALLIVLPFIIWGGFRTNYFGDTGAYRRAFQAIPEGFGELGAYMETITKDRGFYFLGAVWKNLAGSNDVVYFLAFSLLQVGILAWLYRKYSPDYWLSIFLFIASTDYLSWVFNGMRQFTAVVIVLLATPLILKRRYIPAILLILLASTMHQSALLMIPFLFVAQGKAWSKRTMVFLLAVLAAMAFIDRFTDILDQMMRETQYSNVVSDWISWNDDGTNPIRVLVYAMPTLLSLVGLRYIRQAEDPLVDLCTNMSIVSTGLYMLSMMTSGIFMGRLPIYASLYNYILLPWELRHMFAGKSYGLLRAAVVVAYCGFFFYQMHVAWGIL